MGSATGATIPTTFGQTKCNVLVDTGAMKSCMSQAYYQQLMLPTTRPIHTYQVKSANGSNLCPIGITECEFKIGQKEYNKKAEMVLKAYMNHVYCKCGGPFKILSDNGTEFKNKLMEEVSKELGVEYKVYSPPYQPQSNGRIESFHYFLKACI